MGDVFHADIAAGAAAIVDDEGLAGRLLERRGDDARDDIGRSARRVGDHELDRPVGIIGIGRADAQDAGAARPAAADARGFKDNAPR